MPFANIIWLLSHIRYVLVFVHNQYSFLYLNNTNGNVVLIRLKKRRSFLRMELEERTTTASWMVHVSPFLIAAKGNWQTCCELFAGRLTCDISLFFELGKKLSLSPSWERAVFLSFTSALRLKGVFRCPRPSCNASRCLCMSVSFTQTSQKSFLRNANRRLRFYHSLACVFCSVTTSDLCKRAVRLKLAAVNKTSFANYRWLPGTRSNSLIFCITIFFFIPIFLPLFSHGNYVHVFLERV